MVLPAVLEDLLFVSVDSMADIIKRDPQSWIEKLFGIEGLPNEMIWLQQPEPPPESIKIQGDNVDNQQPGQMELLRQALIARLGQSQPAPAPAPSGASGAGQPQVDPDKAKALMAGFNSVR